MVMDSGMVPTVRNPVPTFAKRDNLTTGQQESKSQNSEYLTAPDFYLSIFAFCLHYSRRDRRGYMAVFEFIQKPRLSSRSSTCPWSATTSLLPAGLICGPLSSPLPASRRSSAEAGA